LNRSQNHWEKPAYINIQTKNKKGILMKKTSILLTIFSIALLAIGLSACAGVTKTESREVSGFDSIAISAFGEVQIRQGDTESLTIEAPSDYLRYVESTVENNTLTISTRRGFIGAPVRRVFYTLTVKDLKSLQLSGAGTIKILDGFQTQDFSLNLSGAGSIEIDSLTAKSLTVNFASAGAIVIAGKVDSQSVNLSGVGSYETGDLESKSVNIKLTGAGSATVWATETLGVTVSGVGSINYYGSPQVSQSITGLGSVNSKGAHR
jgi:hypothetical protein